MNHSNKKVKSFILEGTNDLMQNLHYGLSLPYLDSFKPYILYDIEYYNTKSIILKDKDKIVGHTLIYSDNSDAQKILYFGHFKVFSDKEDLIQALIIEMIKYAKENGFNIIRGPINPPTIIYGWGFLNSKKGKNIIPTVRLPMNSPIYLEIFDKSKFLGIKEEISRESRIPKKVSLKGYDLENYDHFNPADEAEFNNLYFNKFCSLQVQNLPEEVSVTPSALNLAKNHIRFIFEFGSKYMFNLIRYKKTNEIVASGCNIPDPFRKDHMVFYSYSVDKNHRRKGLLMLMVKKTYYNLKKLGYNYGSGRFTLKNPSSWNIASKIGAPGKASYLLLEKAL